MFFEKIKMALNAMPIPAKILQRKCGCGGLSGLDGECEECRNKRLQRRVANNVREPETRTFMEPRFGHDFSKLRVQENRVALQPQAIGLGSNDPVHAPLLEEYRRSTGQPPGGIDETGRRVGPTDAELKYSGILGRFGTARWLSPVVNRRNFAEVYFRSTPLSGAAGGLTTEFINESAVHNNSDVEAAIPRPPVESRIEGGQIACWFSHGVNVTGRTTMDIFTPGPWNFEVAKAEAAARFPGNSACQNGSGRTTIHMDARPNEAAMENFVRLGEAEHDADTHQAFDSNIALYVANVNRLIANTPSTRATGANLVDCHAKLRQLENRDLLTQFVLDLNAATDRRHVNQRHGIVVSGISINQDCSRITIEAHPGTL